MKSNSFILALCHLLQGLLGVITFGFVMINFPLNYSRWWVTNILQKRMRAPYARRVSTEEFEGEM